MSSTEQAPEPTMDEILASIRKIISDDEPGDSPQPEAAAGAPAATESVAADDGLANDLANALGDAPEQSEPADDILDLTKVVEEQPQDAAPQGDALQAALVETADAVAPPAAQDSQAASGDAASDENIAALLAEAGVQDTGGDAAPPAPAPEIPAETGNAPSVDETASITEALSAMDQTAPEAALQMPADASMPEEEPAAPAAAPEPAAEEDAFAQVAEASAETASEAETLADAGFTADDVMSEAQQPAIADVPAGEPEALVTEAAAEDDFATVPAFDEAAGTDDFADVDEPAAGTAAAGDGKTLEDSVKEMLRPMLRDWLDDNMERIVQDAVKEEVATGSDKDNG